MTERTERGDLTRRLSRLSPEKRELVQRLLVVDGAASGAAPRPPRGADGLRITRDALGSGAEVAPAERLYDLVNRNLDESPYAAHSVFLNLGYVANESRRLSPIELPRHCLNRTCMELALETIGDVSLDGQEVADVGCGRGGTVAVMKAYYSPRRVVGVDLSRSAVAFCRRTHDLPNVHFVQGDAQALPLRSGSFRVVTNIESASGYPDVGRFYREVSRVLRREGLFLYADVVSHGQVGQRRRQLQEIGFEIESERDVTSNVLLSCDESGRVHRAALGQGHEEQVLANFLGLPDSEIYRRMASRDLLYLIYKARKAGAPARVGP